MKEEQICYRCGHTKAEAKTEYRNSCYPGWGGKTEKTHLWQIDKTILVLNKGKSKNKRIK
jgi:hypothetical protein